jgi:hypothetical protein
MLHLLTAGCGTFETSTDVRYMAARAETYVISMPGRLSVTGNIGTSDGPGYQFFRL